MREGVKESIYIHNIIPSENGDQNAHRLRYIPTSKRDYNRRYIIHTHCKHIKVHTYPLQTH